MSFNSLKKNRSASLTKLTEQLDKISSNNSYADPHEGKFWKLTRDAAKNGFAIIRFLPEPAGEDMPFVKTWDHGFQGPGGWYIENSLTTLNQADPVSEHNTVLWNSGVDADKETARKQKRRLSYVANIYVVKDSGNPDNEGKVFMFKFGKKIFDKLNDLMNPSFADEDPINPFDMWEGADFRLKVRQYEGYANYDKSEFDSPSPLLDGDDTKLEEVYNSIHSLKELLDPKYFKSYDELKEKLHKVLGMNGAASRGAPQKTAEAEVDNELDMSNTSKETEYKSDKSASTEDDEDLAFYKSLAQNG